MDEDEPLRTSKSSPRSRKHARDMNTNGLSFTDQAPTAKRSRRSNGTDKAAPNGEPAKSGDSMEVDQNGLSEAETSSKRMAPTPNSPSVTSASRAVTAAAVTTTVQQHGMEPTATAAVTESAPAEDDALQEQATHTTPMQLEMQMPVPMQMQMQTAGAAPSEGQVESDAPAVLLTSLTLTNGVSVGVQSDKVAELGPETTVLSVPDRTINVTHTLWNPRDPTCLVTGGEKLCRIWTLSRMSTASSSSTQYNDLLEPSDSGTITSMAWKPDGEYLAVATRSSNPDVGGTVDIRTKSGHIHDELPGGQEWVLNLAWNPSGTLLLGITHSDSSESTLIVWDIKTGQTMQPFELQKAIIDATWIDDHKFAVCGHDLIAESVIDGQSIIALRNRGDVEGNQEWNMIRYDAITNTTAIAAEATGILAIIDPSGQAHTTHAHKAEITALAYQPVANPAALPLSSPRLLATSSTDGSIKVFDARRPFTLIRTLSLGDAAQAMAMSFTPDGYLVAAASWNKVLIWNAEVGSRPRASWMGKDESWQIDASATRTFTNGDGVHVEDQSEDVEPPTHSLSWDADGGKLAYGLRNQVWVLKIWSKCCFG